MARFYGNIGFATGQVEDPVGSGNYTNQIVEHPYFGDVIRKAASFESDEKRNSDVSIGHRVSVVGDEFAHEHFLSIRYVQWAGALWTVTNVVVERPRLILTLGDLYHGPSS